MIPIKQPGDGLPDNLPLLTQVADESAPADLPTLTEVVIPPADPSSSARSLSEEEIQRLLKQLESRLEAVFTQKLSLRLEKLQRLAVRQAVNEFRAALPELLRDALPELSRDAPNEPPNSRP